MKRIGGLILDKILENLLSNSLKKLENINKIWSSSNLEEKRQLQKTLFPEGIFYNPQKHEYLTRSVNKFMELVASISDTNEQKNNGDFQNLIENSRLVSRKGELSNQIIRDFISFATLESTFG